MYKKALEDMRERRQPHPELNFGRGRAQRKAMSLKSVIETMKWVGMTDEEIRKAFERKQDNSGQQT
jgi:hypothetical protein